jgi:hypothetical protein
MTRSVVTADQVTPYKEVARVLAAHRISGGNGLGRRYGFLVRAYSSCRSGWRNW